MSKNISRSAYMDNNDLEFIGGGGFANVYLQKSTNLIIKFLKDEYLDSTDIKSRFKREFNIMQSLNDIEGIVKVYEFNDVEYYYVMEKADKTLENFILDDELNENEKKNIICQILEIVSKVHNKNIIHRDINPNNILIFKDKIKISDFGLGKDFTVLTSHQTINTNNYGQYDYCAPEQIKRLGEARYQSDVFSLGKVINFIMTKDSNNYNHILRSVTEKATYSNFIQRYSDAAELYENIKFCYKIHEDERGKIIILDKINHNRFDRYVEEFIYEQSPKELLNNLNNINKYKDAIYKFISIDDNHAKFIIESIISSYRNYYKDFESYDNLADISYKILQGNYSYPIKEMAAITLNYIAYVICRFHAQDLIEKTIENGIEPLLEEKLKP